MCRPCRARCWLRFVSAPATQCYRLLWSTRLSRAYDEQEAESQIQATAQASGWLSTQLAELKVRVDRDQQRLADFENRHGIVSTPEIQANGQPGETEHTSGLLEIDELSRQLVAATTDRILSEAEYRAASQGDPEIVIASDPHLQAENGNFATALLQQIHARRSDLEQEQAQLSAEHGPSFPRVVEIGRQLQDLDRQKQAEDAKLVDRFRSNWQTALDREQLVRKSLGQATGEGMKLNEAATEYAVMRQEANASHDLYMRVLEKSEEAGLAAGVHSSNISVVDLARQPVKPVAPDLAALSRHYFFCRTLDRRRRRSFLRIVVCILHNSCSRCSASVCSRCGASIARAGADAQHFGPAHGRRQLSANAGDEEPAQSQGSTDGVEWRLPAPQAFHRSPATQSSTPMPAPIAAGDFLDISEYHTPEFHSAVRVSAAGTVTLPMIGEVDVSGMDEQAAAHAIEAALLAKGMLLHPLVSVLVTAYAGQDVSVLGEVTRPGVYPYTFHHRLLDLISAASGLSPNAGPPGERLSSRRSQDAASRLCLIPAEPILRPTTTPNSAPATPCR